MSFFRVSFGIIQRSQGGSALRRSAYQRCSRDPDFDFSHKAEELQHTEVNLPISAPEYLADPISLWAAAETAEKRKDAQVARTFDISIPHEVPQHLRNDFARHLLRPLVKRGFCVEWARHDDQGLFGAGENDHISAIVSLRHVSQNGFAKTKDREFNSIMTRDDGRRMRQWFAKRMNAFFKKHAIAASVTAKPLPDGLTVPVAPKGLVRALQRHCKAIAVADAVGRPRPPTPHYVQDFLDRRAAAIEAIGNFRAKQKTQEHQTNERPILTAARTEEEFSTAALREYQQARNSLQQARKLAAKKADTLGNPDTRTQCQGLRDSGANQGTRDRLARADGGNSRRPAVRRAPTRSNREIGSDYAGHARKTRQHRAWHQRAGRNLQRFRKWVRFNRIYRAWSRAAVMASHCTSACTPALTNFPQVTGNDPDAAARFLRQWSAQQEQQNALYPRPNS